MQEVRRSFPVFLVSVPDLVKSLEIIAHFIFGIKEISTSLEDKINVQIRTIGQENS